MRIPVSMLNASPRTEWNSPARSGCRSRSPRRSSSASCCTTSARSRCPDAILFKTSKLTEEEYALIAQHPVVGAEILRDVDFLGEGKLVVRHHHERWDGTGYPDGLGGDEIPLAARVFSVADTLDALTTDRPYRPASDWREARIEIRRFSGTQFDPDVVAAFDAIPDEQFARVRGEL